MILKNVHKRLSHLLSSKDWGPSSLKSMQSMLFDDPLTAPVTASAALYCALSLLSQKLLLLAVLG